MSAFLRTTQFISRRGARGLGTPSNTLVASAATTATTTTTATYKNHVDDAIPQMWSDLPPSHQPMSVPSPSSVEQDNRCLPITSRGPSRTYCRTTLGVRYRSNQPSVSFSAQTGGKKQEEDDDDVTPLEGAKLPHVGKFQNPIVDKLWTAREEAKTRLMSLSDGESPTSGSSTVTKVAASIQATGKDDMDESVVKFRNPSDSATSIDYPFSTDEFLLETYKSPHGGMRIGKILEDLDALAGNIAFNHVVGNPLIVTAAVDRISLRHKPKIGNDMQLSGQVTWTGTSSMEIRMQVHEEGRAQDDHWVEAFFTFVVLDPDTKRPMKIVPLVPETNEERALFELGALKARNKKEARKNLVTVGKPMTEQSLRLDQMAADLLKEAFPLLRMPSLADPNAILMDRTGMQNALVAQPQVRNLHDRIFGGFLMRRAFELAFSTAFIFGGEWPHLLEVDDVSFQSPVDVGDLLVFQSRVLYTRPHGYNVGSNVAYHKDMPLVMIEIESWVTEPSKVDARLSNHFNFTFALPTKKTCRKVLPGNLEEARRMVNRMVLDDEQAGLTATCVIDRER